MKKMVEFISNGGDVRRFHTVNTIGTNTVAEHSFGVVWIIWLLTGGQCRPKLLMAGAAHDLAEQVVGDVPSPAKRALGIGQDIDELETKILADHGTAFVLTPEEARTLKLADCLDGLLFCAKERSQGNRRIDGVADKYAEYIAEMNPCGVERDVFDAVKSILEDARK